MSATFVEFLTGLLVCGVAGFSGALASVFGKVSSLPDVGTPMQVVCMTLLVVCNGLMVVLYTRALRNTTSLQATVATLAVNITATGFLGRAVFGEDTSLQWWIGASTILAGTYFIKAPKKSEEGEAAVAAAPVQPEVGNGAAGAGPPPPPSAPGGGQQEAAQEHAQQAQQQQRCYKLTLAYDGTGYRGFQLQRGPQRQDTVQLRLEAALTRLTGLPREVLKVQAAGRTDAGVHARGQVTHFLTPGGGFRVLDGAALQRGLNSLLPLDIRVLCAARAPPDFNARFALTKTYHYDISTAPVADPFTARFRHCPSRPELLDLGAMEAGAAQFVGTHDFSAFASPPRDGSVRSPVKTLRAFFLEPLDRGVRWVVSGDGYLYKQVRHMVGALLAVGCGRLPAAAVAEALARGAAFTPAQRWHGYRGWTVAEAKGLTLHEVVYPPHDDPSRPMYPGGSALVRGIADKASLGRVGAGTGGGIELEL